MDVKDPVEYGKYVFRGECFEDQVVIAVTRDREDVRQLLQNADDNLAKVYWIYIREVQKAREERGETRSGCRLDLFLNRGALIAPENGRPFERHLRSICIFFARGGR